MSAFSDRCKAMTDIELAAASLAVLSAIMQMSDRVETNGGATSIAGVASLHAMQKSIQANGVRLGELAAEVQARTS